MPDATRRALRNLLQVGVVQAALGLYNAFATVPLTTTQMGAITLFATPLLAFAQNTLEDGTNFPALLKGPASVGQNPQPDTGQKLEPH